MSTSKFTVEQISSALRRAEGGIAVVEICRELGITETTFYRWKRKYHARMPRWSARGFTGRTPAPELRPERLRSGATFRP